MPGVRSFLSRAASPTEIYTLSYTTLFRSLPDVSRRAHLSALKGIFRSATAWYVPSLRDGERDAGALQEMVRRSEEHTSELQSLAYLVCRLLLEKKKHSRLTRT